jgi:transcriptional regulator with XRE-family HTH domain
MIQATKIRQARRMAGLTQFEIARPLGTSIMWLSKVEREELSLDAETEQRILTLIRRLDRINKTTAAKKQELAEDMRITAARISGTR